MAEENSKLTTYVDIVFDGPPGPEAGRFVEVEDASGKSITLGEWLQRPDGYWGLASRSVSGVVALSCSGGIYLTIPPAPVAVEPDEEKAKHGAWLRRPSGSFERRPHGFGSLARRGGAGTIGRLLSCHC